MVKIMEKLTTLSADSTLLYKCTTKTKRLFFFASVLALTACGGGSDGGVARSNAQTPTPTPLPTVTAEPTPTATPAPATPIPTLPPVPDPVIPLTLPSAIEVGSTADQLNVTWEPSNAQEYRVVYWQGDETPSEYLTTGASFSAAVDDGQYSVLVEAYDELGNSVFSPVMTTEVAQ
ncbi:MAG: hypothetical protein COA42_14635 [Alteromonadaceae bacterium]|nr:MAG: hypothetical protein COA42_14635 [Alteromonadaceae bacterium]